MFTPAGAVPSPRWLPASVPDVALSARDRRDVELLWDFHVLAPEVETADILLVLGSHDIRVADHAAHLMLTEAVAPLAVLTGGAGKVTCLEWDRPEAEVYAERMIELGVPRSALVLESLSTNTGENFDFARAVVAGLGITPASGVVVCKPYMARRALATGNKRWPSVRWSANPPVISVWDYPSAETPLDRMINLMVGDLQRLRVYAERGFQSPVEVPDEVWLAYERLAANGFDQFVIR